MCVSCELSGSASTAYCQVWISHNAPSPRCHPGPGREHSASIGPTIAMQAIEVEYFGHRSVASTRPNYNTLYADPRKLVHMPELHHGKCLRERWQFSLD